MLFRSLHHQIGKVDLGLPKYKLSFSAGVGKGHDHAEESLRAAKTKKIAAKAPIGQAQNHIHFHESLGNSEGLAKEMFGSGEERMSKLRSIHGWIAPNGDFHQMEDDDIHDAFISELLGGDKLDEAHKLGEFENRTVSDWARDQGWISVGHTGEPNASGHPNFLNDPNHPATRMLGRIVANLHPDLKKERFLIDSGSHPPYEVPHALASRGIFRKPSVVQQFHRSEDLAKEMYDVMGKPELFDKMRSFHGWISPKGDFHQMEPKEFHSDAIVQAKALLGYPAGRGSGTDDIDASNEGWIISGVGGTPSIYAHHTTLSDPNNLAVKRLAAMVRLLPPAVEEIRVTRDHEDNRQRKSYRVPRHLAERGVFSIPSTVQQFHRSEEDFAASSEDTHKVLNRLRDNFDRIKQHLNQKKLAYDNAPPEQKDRHRFGLEQALKSHAEAENAFNTGVAAVGKHVVHKKPGEE